jgi:hypothetical protein
VIAKPLDVQRLHLLSADDRCCVIACNNSMAASHPTTTILRLAAKAGASLLRFSSVITSKLVPERADIVDPHAQLVVTTAGFLAAEHLLSSAACGKVA